MAARTLRAGSEAAGVQPCVDLALGGQLEALLRAGMGLHLRHDERWRIAGRLRPAQPALKIHPMLDRRRWDPYRVPRDLEWVGAVVAAVIIVGLVAFLVVKS